MAERVLGKEWSAFDYGMHSLRIGRENGLRAADVRPELINDITSHTSIRGRQAYSRAEVAELVTASRLADSVVARPVEKAVSFGADRSVPRGAVYVDSEGSVLGGSVVEKGSRSACSGASAVSAVKSGGSAPRKRAPGQLSIQSALSNRGKS